MGALEQFPAQPWQKTSSICACSTSNLLIHLISPAHTNPHLSASRCHRADIQGSVFFPELVRISRAGSSQKWSIKLSFFFSILVTRRAAKATATNNCLVYFISILISSALAEKGQTGQTGAAKRHFSGTLKHNDASLLCKSGSIVLTTTKGRSVHLSGCDPRFFSCAPGGVSRPLSFSHFSIERIKSRWPNKQ